MAKAKPKTKVKVSVKAKAVKAKKPSVQEVYEEVLAAVHAEVTEPATVRCDRCGEMKHPANDNCDAMGA